MSTTESSILGKRSQREAQDQSQGDEEDGGTTAQPSSKRQAIGACADLPTSLSRQFLNLENEVLAQTSIPDVMAIFDDTPDDEIDAFLGHIVGEALDHLPSLQEVTKQAKVSSGTMAFAEWYIKVAQRQVPTEVCLAVGPRLKFSGPRTPTKDSTPEQVMRFLVSNHPDLTTVWQALKNVDVSGRDILQAATSLKATKDLLSCIDLEDDSMSSRIHQLLSSEFVISKVNNIKPLPFFSAPSTADKSAVKLVMNPYRIITHPIYLYLLHAFYGTPPQPSTDFQRTLDSIFTELVTKAQELELEHHIQERVTRIRRLLNDNKTTGILSFAHHWEISHTAMLAQELAHLLGDPKEQRFLWLHQLGLGSPEGTSKQPYMVDICGLHQMSTAQVVPIVFFEAARADTDKKTQIGAYSSNLFRETEDSWCLPILGIELRNIRGDRPRFVVKGFCKFVSQNERTKLATTQLLDSELESEEKYSETLGRLLRMLWFWQHMLAKLVSLGLHSSENPHSFQIPSDLPERMTLMEDAGMVRKEFDLRGRQTYRSPIHSTLIPDAKVIHVGENLSYVEYPYREHSDCITGKHIAAVVRHLGEVHNQGICHGDVRLANIVMTNPPDRSILIDFDMSGSPNTTRYPSGYVRNLPDTQRHPEAIEHKLLHVEHDRFSLAASLKLLEVGSHSSVLEEVCTRIKSTERLEDIATEIEHWELNVPNPMSDGTFGTGSAPR